MSDHLEADLAEARSALGKTDPQESGIIPGHSVRAPSTNEVAETDRKALDRIAWILASPDWSVGMLEDIAVIVEQAGHVVEQHDEYIHH